MDGTHAQVIDQVFLTPRVLDAKAFTEYSVTLQELLKEAAGHQSTLQTVSSEMQTLRHGLRDAMAELQKRLDTAVKVLPGIDSRLAKAEQLVAEADRALNVEPMEQLRAMRLESSKVTFESMQQFQSEIAAAFEAAIQQSRLQTDALLSRSAELEAHAISLASTFESRLQQRADELARAAQESIGVFDAQARLYDERLSRRGEELESHMRAQAIATERAIDAKLAQLESRMAQFESDFARTSQHQAQAAVASVIEQAAAIEQRTVATITEASARSAKLHQMLDVRLDETAKSTEATVRSYAQILENAGPSLQESQILADRLGALLVTARDFIESDQGGGAIREVRQLAKRLETVRADSDFAARQFDEIRKQADLARTSLGQALLEAATGADQMLSRSDEVVARTHECGTILQNLIAETNRAEQVAATAQALSTRKEELESATDQLTTTIDALAQKKVHLENELRRTGELLDLADVSLAERYNQLGAAIQRGTLLSETINQSANQSMSKLEALSQQELAVSRRYTLAQEQLEQAIAASSAQLAAQTQEAARRVEALIRDAQVLDSRLAIKTVPANVSASTLFPTAR